MPIYCASQLCFKAHAITSLTIHACPTVSMATATFTTMT